MRLEVSLPAVAQSRDLDGLHGVGVVACAGAALGLLIVSAGWWAPATLAGTRPVLLAGAGILDVTGALLFLTAAGQPLGEDPSGRWAARLQPGLPLTAAAGAALLVSAVLAGPWPRGWSRSRW